MWHLVPAASAEPLRTRDSLEGVGDPDPTKASVGGTGQLGMTSQHNCTTLPIWMQVWTEVQERFM